MTTILITRPLAEARQLADLLDNVGIGSIVMPLYDFSARAPDIAINKVFAASTGRKLAIFTSPRAVKFGLEYLPSEIRTGVEIAAIGEATCRQLENAGLKVDWKPATGFTSEDLLGVAGLSLDDNSATGPASKEGTAIIVTAPGGRNALQTGLQSKGWVVSKALVYQRKSLTPGEQSVTAILESQDLLSIWTSTSALNGAQKRLPASVWTKILNSPALVISARIKHHLQQQGVSDITLADGPGNADLLQSICKLAGIQQSSTC